LISETFFANSYPSFWRSLTPSMDEFVRRANLKAYERDYAPLTSDVAAGRRGLVNEAAFNLFERKILEKGVAIIPVSLDDVRAAFDQARTYIFPRDPEVGEVAEPSQKEMGEAATIAQRLDQFFRSKDTRTLNVRPPFKGCGLIGNCFGDVLVANQLYEIKSGERPFRSRDFRQVAIYVALEFARNRSLFRSIHLVNPRRGVRVDVSIEDFANEIAGISAANLCQNLIERFSNVGSSQ